MSHYIPRRDERLLSALELALGVPNPGSHGRPTRERIVLHRVIALANATRSPELAAAIRDRATNRLLGLPDPEGQE